MSNTTHKDGTIVDLKEVEVHIAPVISFIDFKILKLFRMGYSMSQAAAKGGISIEQANAILSRHLAEFNSNK